jgi:hypothetical protein
MKNNDISLLNLKILSRILPGNKIIKDNEGVIKFVNVNYQSSFYRTILRESRVKTVEYLNDIYNTVEEIVSYILNSKYYKYALKKELSDSFLVESYTNEVLKHKETLMYIKEELENLPEALENLKQTYRDDVITLSKLDLVKSKFQSLLAKISKHLS